VTGSFIWFLGVRVMRATPNAQASARFHQCAVIGAIANWPVFVDPRLFRIDDTRRSDCSNDVTDHWSRSLLDWVRHLVGFMAPANSSDIKRALLA
jgi:hypothetical protein